ncbi:hypothetical protein HMPREF9436_00104 [Faecalibacterium cf. prausnitzii KLE1255]|uniref:Uncharacterized protein n=1 Tax=Faecalibacterium cf. prausnitzii KLE1255 TaxID=748224 RepID=E2ZEM6_9FIRM|nr:hypothetical protein HMPREF9436_00104 [Faecalibacterium cf. prausnitzii KLE1255]
MGKEIRKTEKRTGKVLCALDPKGESIQRFAFLLNTGMYPSVRRRCTNKK